ncbi:GGDEF domain-containing protein [Acetobacteraceae bacterium H6797]|nr:GGDEF domain-containing protein [Acetobacteraceae bacterium H6797]
MKGAEPPPASVLPPPSADGALRAALLESRQRWRDALLMAVDFVFETDIQGRFTFIAPDPALGHTGCSLLGQPASSLLLDPALDPFQLFQPLRDRRVWLRRGGGGSCCVALCLAPLHDESGRPIGLRGTARDITSEEQASLDAAASLRRTAMLDQVMQTARQEKLIDLRMRRVMEGFCDGVGCMGLALLERKAGQPLLIVGEAPEGFDPAKALASAAVNRFAHHLFPGPHGEPLIFFGLAQGQGQPAGLLGWRAAGARDFDGEESDLLRRAAEILGGMRHQALEREALEREAGTDPLTGLLNRRAFVAELERRLARVAMMRGSGAGGSLIYVDLDNFKPLNDQFGHAAGDAALKRIAVLLRDGVRPSDLVGRLGGDEFAAWLDGAEEDVAAARAEALHRIGQRYIEGIGADGRPLSMSIGIAAARPGIAESTASLLARADAAMYAAKRLGRGRWSVAPPMEAP